MTGEAIVLVAASVVSLTQLIKWAGLNDRLGPIVVLLLSLFGVLFWGWAQNALSREMAFDFFAGWVAVATSASGVYGFTRASAEAVMRMSPPPNSGAGSEPTVKS